MLQFIDDNREAYGVEPICDVLPIAPATYYEHRARQLDPDRRPARAKRGEELSGEILRVWNENVSVYGAEKVLATAAPRENIDVARCTVERLMRAMGLRGAVRGGASKVTTVADNSALRPPGPCRTRLPRDASPIRLARPPTSRRRPQCRCRDLCLRRYGQLDRAIGCTRPAHHWKYGAGNRLVSQHMMESVTGVPDAAYTFTYDVPGFEGAANLLGQVSSIDSPVGSTSWSYDEMGKAVATVQDFPSPRRRELRRADVSLGCGVRSARSDAVGVVARRNADRARLQSAGRF